MATSEYAPEERYRPRDRRAPADRPAKAEAAAATASTSDAPGPIFDPAYYASRFKTDLSLLRTFDGAEEGQIPMGEAESGLADFFGNLSTLLVAVRAGDITRAQAAADALELDALMERNAPKRPGASAPLLGDLVAMLSAAQSRNESAARVAAQELAADFQNAISPVPLARPEAYAEDAEPDDDGGAAYDTLKNYNDGAAGAV